jgi:2-polyprenyl-3-methyl-5-hydroxy-6-metoxy-1,4-benzoquinol methylase
MLKTDDLIILIHQKWTQREIDIWARDKYWFQGFSFLPKQRADSELVWRTINQVNWSGLTVLDVGCHYGYMSFKASEVGARVIGMDTNEQSLQMARTIQRHVIQQDVKFTRQIPRLETRFDVVLYLSVHQQVDPTYTVLSARIGELKKRARLHLFVELILPPMFPKNRTMTEKEIDNIVGGKKLLTYKHKVRGTRNIYWIQK